MKKFYLFIAMLLAVLFCFEQAAQAQALFISSGNGFNGRSLAIVNSRGFNSGFNRSFRLQGRADRLNARANLIQLQQQRALQRQLFRSNLRSAAFINTRQDLATLQALRQLQQINAFQRTAAFNNSLFVPQQNFLVNRSFLSARHCR